MTTTDPMYALFDGDRRISKAHSSKEAVAVEAYERKLVLDYSADFAGDKASRSLPNGISIREVDHDHD